VNDKDKRNKVLNLKSSKDEGGMFDLCRASPDNVAIVEGHNCDKKNEKEERIHKFEKNSLRPT
jgi:hypothetical protein